MSSLFDCTCCWALFIAHSYFGILYLVMHSGDLCPDFSQQYHLPSICAKDSVLVSLSYLSSVLLFDFGCLWSCFSLYLCLIYDYSTRYSYQQSFLGNDSFPVIYENLDSVSLINNCHGPIYLSRDMQNRLSEDFWPLFLFCLDWLHHIIPLYPRTYLKLMVLPDDNPISLLTY